MDTFPFVQHWTSEYDQLARCSGSVECGANPLVLGPWRSRAEYCCPATSEPPLASLYSGQHWWRRWFIFSREAGISADPRQLYCASKEDCLILTIQGSSRPNCVFKRNRSVPVVF